MDSVILMVVTEKLSLFFSGRTFFDIQNRVEKYRRDWIEVRYQYEIFKLHAPLLLPSELFPTQHMTQPLDHFNPEIQVSVLPFHLLDLEERH